MKYLIHILWIILIGVLVSCSSPKTKEIEPLAIKIGCSCDNLTFNSLYRDYLDAQFPGAQISLVHMNADNVFDSNVISDLKLVLDTEKPDLIMVNSFVYRILSDAGVLEDLQPRTSATGFNMASIEPGVIDSLQTNNDSKLYGLSSFFHSNAIFYNKDLFKKIGIDIPTGELTWKDLISLSARFEHDGRMDEGSFGLHINLVEKPSDLIYSIASTEGVHMYDPQTGEINLQASNWKDIFQTSIDAYKLKALSSIHIEPAIDDQGSRVYNQEQVNQMQLFQQGKAALTIANDLTLVNFLSSPPPFEWGVVVGPVSARDPQRVSGYYPDMVYSIPTDSAAPDKAWKVIESMVSDELGLKLAPMNNGLFVRSDFVKWKKDPRFEAFYGKRPSPAPSWINSKLSMKFRSDFFLLVQNKVDAVMSGSKTVDEAISEIQQEGEALRKSQQ
jgi:multiple sugar transport system substrate-binding protein